MLHRTLDLRVLLLATLAQSLAGQSWNSNGVTQIAGFGVDHMTSDAAGLVAYNATSQKVWLEGPGGWSSFNASPSVRQWATCASASGNVYLFGGATSAGYENDLFRFDRSNNDWQQLAPTTIGGPGPSARIYSVAAATPNGLLFFGGKNIATFFQDTWTMQDNGGSVSWVQHPTPATLWPRFAHAMAPAPGGTVVLFGGAASFFGPVLDDCWVFDPVAGMWTEHTGTKPPATTSPSMQYDPVRDLTVLVHPNDSTWEWNGFEWREVPITSSQSWSQPKVTYDASHGTRVFKISPNSFTEHSYAPSIVDFEITLATTCSQAGGQPLLLDAFENDLPFLGETMQMMASGMASTSLVVGGIELSNSGTSPLSCGCMLGLNATATVFTFLPGSGAVRQWSFDVPNNNSVSGITLDAQAFAVEPLNACFLTATQRATLTLGR